VLEIGVALMLMRIAKASAIATHAPSAPDGCGVLGRWSYEIYLFHMLPLIGLSRGSSRVCRLGTLIIATYIACC
jgi:peptidoglycan/LPS O-acetylase OafA/YrhL